jgi:hypothetical protein
VDSELELGKNLKKNKNKKLIRNYSNFFTNKLNLFSVLNLLKKFFFLEEENAASIQVRRFSAGNGSRKRQRQFFFSSQINL